MIRAVLVLSAVGLSLAADAAHSRFAWPLRALVTTVHGRAVQMLVVSESGSVVVAQVGQRGNIPVLQQVAPGDTLRITTPSTLPMDLTHGRIRFHAIGADTLRVMIQSVMNQWDYVEASGRSVTARLVGGKVVLASP